MARSMASNLRRIAVASTALAGSLTLAACLGSDEDGTKFFGRDTGFREGGGGQPQPIYDSDPEYQALSGLALIGASAVYASGATGYTGSGITVAVIDTGIDFDHPEFIGALHPASTSVISGQPLDDVGGHGTQVAGVVGANRNGIGMHGVAFNSTILAIRADFPGTCPVACGFLETDLANATNLAVSQNAAVINYSLGGPSPSGATFRNALINAVLNGSVIIAAAGNEFIADPVNAVDPLYPAQLAIDPAMNGQMIAAGAYDEGTGDIAAFSNRAGVAADYYLMAPGVNVYTAAVGGGYADVDGTSFAAPYISGAAAILKERFPALTAAQIVDILLVSATDLGAPGTDPIYGRGLLDLAAAAAPLGAVSIPSGATVDGGGSDPNDTVLVLGAAFGDALSRSEALAGAMFLDGYDRPYGIDLTASVGTTWSGPDLLGFVSGEDGVERFEMALTPVTVVRLHAAADEEAAASRYRATLAESGPEASFSVRHRIAEGVDLTVAQGQGAGGRFGLSGIGAPIGTGMLGAADTAFMGMADDGGNAAIATRLGNGLVFRLGVGVSQAALGDREEEGSAEDASVYVAEMSHVGTSGARLGIQVGRLLEDGSLLDSSGEGGFALDGSSDTDFVSAFGVVPLTAQVDLFGSYTAGQTDADALSTDLIGDFDGLFSESFSLGVAARDLFAARDRLAVTVVRPLRVSAGSATVTSPISRTLEGDVVYQRETLALAPSGHETDAELSYGFAIGPGERLDFSFVTRIEPDHVQDASPEFHGGLRYRLDF